VFNLLAHRFIGQPLMLPYFSLFAIVIRDGQNKIDRQLPFAIKSVRPPMIVTWSVPFKRFYGMRKSG